MPKTTFEQVLEQLPELKKMIDEHSKINSKRYIEVLGGIGAYRRDLLDTEPVSGYTGLGMETLSIGEFTRKNVAKFLESGYGPEHFPTYDFHAVCDGIEIPWADEESGKEYRRHMGGTKS